MNKLAVFYNDKLAGWLERDNDGFAFHYDETYRLDPTTRPIAISFPKTKSSFESPVFFPFFYNMLSEGENRQLQCRFYQIDEQDFFTLLGYTAQSETIGPITVQPDE